MPRIAYVNGSYVPHHEASVHIEDRGFQFADGIYEVVACINGKMTDERGHLDRLERSLDELGIPMPVTRRSLQFIIREMVRRNRLKNANVYIQVTRGVAKRDFPFPVEVPPSIVLTARNFQFDNNKNVEKGVTAMTVADIRWKRRDIKTTMLLAQVLAKQEAMDGGAYDAWMVDDEGFVTEASSSNAWIVTKDGKLVTRNATTSILRGVTRTAFEKICSGLQMKIEERAFTPAEAYEAQEAFNTSAVALVVPVIMLDGKKIGTGEPGPVAKKLYAEYRAYAEGQRGEHVEWVANLDEDEA
ncbi:MAG: aminotransferase class family protein [Micavibrio sp.]|nr:aminotransferase class family protein [Micavibrio sp.]